MCRMTIGGLLALLTSTAVPTIAQTGGPTADSPETVVRGLYDLVSWEAGETPDWNALRGAFLPEAVVFLRYRELTQFSVETFIQDFMDFASRSSAGSEGFVEDVVSAKSWEYGDIAHVVTVYEASIRGSDRPPTRGVDSWSLVRLDGEWNVASVVNELIRPDRPDPLGPPD